jgi:hypothetical protein
MSAGWDGSLFMRQSDGSEYHYNSSTNSWVAYSGACASYIAGADGGTLYALGCEGTAAKNPFYWNGSSWVRIYGESGVQLANTEHQGLFLLDTSGSIWHYNGGSSWTEISGYTDMLTNSGWILAAHGVGNNSVYLWNGTGWELASEAHNWSPTISGIVDLDCRAFYMLDSAAPADNEYRSVPIN